MSLRSTAPMILRKTLFASVALIYLCSVLGGQALALTNKDIGDILNGNTYYDANAVLCNSPTTHPTESATTGTAISGVDITVYSPRTGGDPIEGGLESSQVGLDGVALVRTLDDVHAGTSTFVTLAGDPSLYKKQYTIPTITYDSYASGKKESVTLTNVTAYVHDTGSAFTGKPEGRYDVAVGKDYTDAQINSQPFANNSPKTEPKIQLIPSTGAAASPAATNVPAGAAVYMVGDSIAEGSTPALNEAFATNGFSVKKINAFVGRSITTTGAGGHETGLQAIENDAKLIADSQVVIVELGTNGASEAGVKQMIDAINAKNDAASIFWVNIFSPGASNRDSFNQILDAQSKPLGFTVINANLAKIEVGGDGLHPTTAGQTTFAQTVANGIKGGSPTVVTASGCSCSAGGSTATNGTIEENEKNAWAYFIGKGLSPEAAAGLMGGIASEGSFDPQNVQNTAKGIPDGPEIPINSTTTDGISFKGHYGYGLIQWTSPNRQDGLIAYARETNRSTGDLGLQLDFLWKELSEGYTGPLAELQTPGITVQEASDEVTLNFIIPGSVTESRGTPESRANTLRERGELSQGFFATHSGESGSFSGGAGCSASGGAIDLVTQDTTNILCQGSTTDAGVADGYRDGKLYKIRICSVGGTQVNSQISGSIEKMLADAASVGLGFEGGGGSFRDMAAQIDTYLRWCANDGIPPSPGPYPRPKGTTTRCPGGGAPGYSNHQMGLAFDFTCNGDLIGQSYSAAQSNPCFQWLIANASKYGLYEYGKGQSRNKNGYEGWHWSVDGG